MKKDPLAKEFKVAEALRDGIATERAIARAMIELSTITCPKCSYQALERMPTNACQFLYDCKGCGEELKPKPGDCCVFCSYGSVPCPPIQEKARSLTRSAGPR